ncbi:MAG TPA: pentapeptide repeat-containing protein, partial [Candidatus Methylomirabilis sp.]|nr:pentapeptide repeat-containing protein [Candidatus Methylomirabilis sp.]
MAVCALLAAALYWGAGAWRDQRHSRAWEIVKSAARKDPRLVQALEELNRDRVSLEGIDLSAAVLPRVALPQARLSSAILRQVNLEEANLRRADLSGANLQNAVLSKADLVEANLGGAD